MHEFKCIEINAKEIINVAENLIKENRRLVIINGYINKNKENVICYNFDIDGDIVTYKVTNVNEIMTLTSIYKESARWCEEEIEEVMNVKFIGLNRSNRLFLPEEFKDGEGQILIMPLDELKKYKKED
ncbi:NADH-quinone oxidoreductase subunit C [Clostridium sp. Ade.TY]|uniref:NADH-quinone oxidoreductase subunit C n=1 Tax=Clostridium sp. Ade.TY TaxID=1391647 RepID=UPI000402D7CC|nr:NADH-quinone oxidoreductase subunit C [Clostridium sp. Ade.TY]